MSLHCPSPDCLTAFSSCHLLLTLLPLLWFLCCLKCQPILLSALLACCPLCPDPLSQEYLALACTFTSCAYLDCHHIRKIPLTSIVKIAAPSLSGFSPTWQFSLFGNIHGKFSYLFLFCFICWKVSSEVVAVLKIWLTAMSSLPGTALA